MTTDLTITLTARPGTREVLRALPGAPTLGDRSVFTHDLHLDGGSTTVVRIDDGVPHILCTAPMQLPDGTLSFQTVMEEHSPPPPFWTSVVGGTGAYRELRHLENPATFSSRSWVVSGSLARSRSSVPAPCSAALTCAGEAAGLAALTSAAARSTCGLAIEVPEIVYPPFSQVEAMHTPGAIRSTSAPNPQTESEPVAAQAQVGDLDLVGVVGHVVDAAHHRRPRTGATVVEHPDRPEPGAGGPVCAGCPPPPGSGLAAGTASVETARSACTEATRGSRACSAAT